MNERDFSHQLSDLREVAVKLNEESDSLIKLIEQFQETLRPLNLGLEVWIPLQSEESTFTPTVGSKIPVPVRIETSLGYARGDDGWALYLKRVAYRSKAATTLLGVTELREAVKVNKWIKLVDASRAVRLAALDAFPKLLDALKASAESAVRAIQNAKTFLG